ncbi:hypothetical protein VTK56DRAFT_1700 [Thermocarpiscus australiensis]
MHSQIPVPEVFAYSASRDHDIGIPFILMSRAAGHPLWQYNWVQPPCQPAPKCSLGDTLKPPSEEGMKKVMTQLGGIVSQLSRLRFDKIGSLSQDDKGNYIVGECLSQSLTWQQRDSLEDIDRGPFDSERTYLESLVSAFVSHAKELPMSPHAFFAPIPNPSEYDSWASYRAAAGRWNDFVAVGQKIDHGKNRLAYCIAGQLMCEAIIPSLCSAAPHGDDGFPLGHPDLHLGNIFVDDNLNITGIIDWASASTVPFAELLACPRMLQASASPAEKPLAAAFQARFKQASHVELVAPDVWKRADMMRLFHRLVRMLSTQDYHDFAALYALARCWEDNEEGQSDEGTPDITALFAERARRSENKQLLLELAEDDSPQDYVKRQEQASVGSRSRAHPEKLAVARKLTLMSEMNERFVADRKLWRWSEDAMEDIIP